jgi:hypothetical protein
MPGHMASNNAEGSTASGTSGASRLPCPQSYSIWPPLAESVSAMCWPPQSPLNAVPEAVAWWVAASEVASGIAQPPQASTSSRIGEIAAKNRSRLIAYTL